MVHLLRKKKKNKAKEVMETIEKVEQAAQSFEERKASRTLAEQAFEEVKKKRVSSVHWTHSQTLIPNTKSLGMRLVHLC